MSKSEVLYVKGMNISDTEFDEGDNDVWDDSKLNDAYDKAVRIANAEVAKRVAMATNSQHGEKEGRTKLNKDKSSSHASSSKHSKKEQWKAGMPCRATYEGDGLVYEAYILRIINDKECIVRFLGYENSEIVSLSALRPTLGKDARTMQLDEAAIDDTENGFRSLPPKTEKMDVSSDRPPSAGSTERSFPKKKKSSNKKKKNQNQQSVHRLELPEMPLPMPNPSFIKSVGAMDMPMPPPPLMLPSSSDRVDSEEQAVSSMLLSWYMSGYYTGLYQGLRRAKENRKN